LTIRETDPQVRYISDLSQIPIKKIEKVRFSVEEADMIIKKLLDKNTKQETITMLEDMAEKEIIDEKQRMRANITNTDPDLAISEDK